jgi:uncharacterized membrane protein (UPF0182 family)
MEEPQTFYNLEDLWDIPKENYEGNSINFEPYYIYGKIAGEETLSYLLVMPFTPTKRNNLISILIVKCDPGPDYGKIYVYKMPKQELVYGPMQIESRIDQDADISRDLTLWSQQGSRVIRGNMMLVPIANSLLYIEPIYLQATASKLPELKRIIVANGDNIAMTEDLFRSIAVTIGAAPRSPLGQQAVLSLKELAEKAKSYLNQAELALRSSAWGDFGDNFNKLKETLGAMDK